MLVHSPGCRQALNKPKLLHLVAAYHVTQLQVITTEGTYMNSPCESKSRM
jgi:hypothetical protein